MALGVKEIPHFRWTPVKCIYCHLSKASGPLPLQSPISNRTFSDRPIAASLKAGLDTWEDSDQWLRFVTQANLSPWYVKLTTVSSVVKDQYKQCRCCDLSIVFSLRRSLCTVPAVDCSCCCQSARTFVENFVREIVIALHCRFILLHLGFVD